MYSRTNGFLSDPRLRSKFQEFMSTKGSAPYNPPGYDTNVAQQGMNAVQGQNKYRTAFAPRANQGQQLQNFLRNRSAEQSGTTRPAATNPVPMQTWLSGQAPKAKATLPSTLTAPPTNTSYRTWLQGR